MEYRTFMESIATVPNRTATAWRLWQFAAFVPLCVLQICGCGSTRTQVGYVADPSFQPKFASRHDCVERERNLRDSLVDDPHNADAWTQLADALREQRKFRAASAAYARAAELAKQDAPTQYRYAACLDALGDSKAALRQVDRALKQDRDFAEAHALRGKLLREEGRNAEALRELDKAWRGNPPSTLAGFELAKWDRRRGADAAAAEKLAQCVARQPGDARARKLYAITLADLGRNQDAIREWETLISRGEIDAEGPYRVAELYAMQGMQEQAWDAFAEGRRIDPTHRLVREVGPIVAGRSHQNRATPAYPELVSNRR